MLRARVSKTRHLPEIRERRAALRRALRREPLRLRATLSRALAVTWRLFPLLLLVGGLLQAPITWFELGVCERSFAYHEGPWAGCGAALHLETSLDLLWIPLTGLAFVYFFVFVTGVVCACQRGERARVLPNVLLAARRFPRALFFCLAVFASFVLATAPIGSGYIHPEPGSPI